MFTTNRDILSLPPISTCRPSYTGTPSLPIRNTLLALRPNNKLFLAQLIYQPKQASIDCPQIIALQNRYATHSIKLEYPRYQLCHIILQLVFVRNWHSSIRTQWTFCSLFSFLSVQPYLLLLSIITLPLISLCAMRLSLFKTVIYLCCKNNRTHPSSL